MKLRKKETNFPFLFHTGICPEDSWKPESCSCEDPLDPPDWLGREEQDWSRLVRSQEDCETVLEVGEVSVEDTDDFEGTEEVGEDSTLYCRSEILEGRGRSRDDFCRINLALALSLAWPLLPRSSLVSLGWGRKSGGAKNWREVGWWYE